MLSKFSKVSTFCDSFKSVVSIFCVKSVSSVCSVSVAKSESKDKSVSSTNVCSSRESSRNELSRTVGSGISIFGSDSVEVSSVKDSSKVFSKDSVFSASSCTKLEVESISSEISVSGNSEKSV